MTDLAKLQEGGIGIEEQAIERAVTPMQLLEMAVNQGADIDKLTKLMDLAERWNAGEAKRAFIGAMKAFKENAPEIIKNKLVTFGNTSYRHATLDEVCDKITEGLSQHGMSHRWKIEQQGAAIRVTCILTHIQGHSEETTLEAGADTSGSKNSIQAIASSVTYLERYTLLAATGLAAANGDNDGAGAPIMEALDMHLDRIKASDSLAILDKAFKEAFKAAMDVQDSAAMKAILAAKDARKKALADAQ